MREMTIWGASFSKWDGYVEAGQGMSPTFRIADEKGAYVLADEGTYLRLRSTMRIVPLVTDDPVLKNPYGAILVRSSGDTTRHAAAKRFVEWLAGARAQALVKGIVIEGRRPFFLPDERPSSGG
jgi:tungstate transport system substrate-binding protein